ncbi:MAG: hypothetical protein HY685_05255 [Chloroflexi bacterium]|nr:hypothetical protein [Chloroflexota bacterium]
MRRIIIVVSSTLFLAIVLTAVAYANDVKPPLSATVSLTSKTFNINGHTYGGLKGAGVTVPFDAGAYTWTITNNDKVRHTFEVENEITDTELPLNGGGATILNFPKGGPSQTATLTLVESGTSRYKVYCTLHEKVGMFFFLDNTP